MGQVVIDNPILNSPFREPDRHFRFDENGITDQIVEARRTSAYFIPIAQPRKKGKQLQFETDWTQDRLEENRMVNLIRQRVGAWRKGGHVGVTATRSRLLSYWANPDRERPLFFIARVSVGPEACRRELQLERDARRPELQFGRDDEVNLIIEVTGEARRDKAPK